MNGIEATEKIRDIEKARAITAAVAQMSGVGIASGSGVRRSRSGSQIEERIGFPTGNRTTSSGRSSVTDAVGHKPKGDVAPRPRSTSSVSSSHSASSSEAEVEAEVEKVEN